MTFRLEAGEGRPWPSGWRACLRTNLGRAEAARAEIIASVENRRPPTLASWRDLPLRQDGESWQLRLPLVEVGYFRAKAYAIDPRGWQHWPQGPDVGINVQPNSARTANALYCAFTRVFGPTRAARTTSDPALETRLRSLDELGYTVIPPSGKFRDLIRVLPHIFDTLGCRILHLLPVNPTPTTLGRFGRFGSPYACQDLLQVDPALVEFDRRTTGTDQFRELTTAVHRHGGRVFLDVVINHTGWGATLQGAHPEWFTRTPDGQFVSPGAWGTTWEDLVELDHRSAALRHHLGEVFLEWCRRGVDGFRCDAGYKVPLPVWQYLTARVRQEFPDTVFLLEGLGGAWEATESLLTEGGLQWAYSELFQNYGGTEVAGYLDHALRQSQRVGLLVHYSETHDNDRLAARGRAWALLRHRLCALTSVSGAFGFTCGGEWLAPERINVHSSRGLAWDNPDAIVPELARLNRLLSSHPCFFDGASLTRLSPPDAPVYVLLRQSAEGADTVLVLANTDSTQPQRVPIPAATLAQHGLDSKACVDLLDQPLPTLRRKGDSLECTLAPAAVHCLAPQPAPRGLAGDLYRHRRATEALALTVLSHHLPIEALGDRDRTELGRWLDRDPEAFLAAAARLGAEGNPATDRPALEQGSDAYPQVVVWREPDLRRVTLVPPRHWLMLLDASPFRAVVSIAGEPHPRHAESILTQKGHVALFPPRLTPGDATLEVDRLAADGSGWIASLRYLGPTPDLDRIETPDPASAIVLLTNGRGGMARLAIDLGRIHSKYDCLLAANLHPQVPVDRHVFVKRLRAWISADGFLSPLDGSNLVQFTAGPPATWQFVAPAGDGRAVPIELRIAMLPGRNTTVLAFRRLPDQPPEASPLPASAEVRLTVRLDLEDRDFHCQTRRNPGAEHHFTSHCHPLPPRSAPQTTRLKPGAGFEFRPDPGRTLRAWTTAGQYHPQPEWCEAIPHPIEASRGHEPTGDAFSPGWFEIPLPASAESVVVVGADPTDPDTAEIERALAPASRSPKAKAVPNPFAVRLQHGIDAFLVRRDNALSIIAGYPWFLDWSRDALISARGLLAADRIDDVRQILQVYGRWEQQGTLPNNLRGDDASNRETSDAPLWYGVACEEWAHAARPAAEPAKDAVRILTQTHVAPRGRTLADVLGAIGSGYCRGTPAGVRVDPASGLVWSPAHFTWMDTNHPAGTPREGYPVCIQALWIRFLRLLARLEVPPATEPWQQLAHRALASLESLFWLEDPGYYADVLIASPKMPAAAAVPDTALRSNQLLPVAFGLVDRRRARRCVAAAVRHLLIPGAVRSLAPLPVSPPLPIRAPDGRLLNDPERPYWGRYEGDEDTRRKPAYHNGTAWTWTLPMLAEAMAEAWDHSPAAVAAARAYLGSMDRLLAGGCVGQLPEIVDGDAPHSPRGCDAQAWAATETLRAWRKLSSAPLP